ncbi:X-linked retinitis pigmentosa GTPase regulator [Pelomyxa schiedti]|nr:X-linked retinitis pigmentosa GTPase regulator [Pelomyxa schiedti]
MASLTPVLVSFCPPEVKVCKVTCGENHTAVITEEGRLYTFGDNKTGQLGTGDNTQRNTPSLVNFSADTRVIQIAAGGAHGQGHTIAVVESGSIYSWGSNSEGQLGLGDLVNRNTPTIIPALDKRRIFKIACGWTSSACLVASQRPKILPVNKCGVLGDFNLLPFELILCVLRPVFPNFQNTQSDNGLS